VWAGIAAAQAAGLTPIKLNMVVVRGLNDDEVVDLAQRTVSDGWHVAVYRADADRGQRGVGQQWYSADQGGAGRIEAALGPLEAVGQGRPAGNGPARYYRLPGATGTVGFIAAISEHFCHACNRLRLTADGRLRPCLMSDEELDLRPALRRGAELEEVKELLIQAIRSKPERHHLDEAEAPQGRTMSEIGG